jgi:hypothetical protein
MHSSAIQVALDNLVEAVRTSVTAELLEFFRGDAKPARVKGARPSKQKKPVKKRRAGKAKKKGRTA